MQDLTRVDQRVGGHVRRVDGPPARIGQQLLGDRGAERIGTLQQHAPQLDDPVRRRAVDKRPRGVNRTRLVARAPASDRIEVL